MNAQRGDRPEDAHRPTGRNCVTPLPALAVRAVQAARDGARRGDRRARRSAARHRGHGARRTAARAPRTAASAGRRPRRAGAARRSGRRALVVRRPALRRRQLAPALILQGAVREQDLVALAAHLVALGERLVAPRLRGDLRLRAPRRAGPPSACARARRPRDRRRPPARCAIARSRSSTAIAWACSSSCFWCLDVADIRGSGSSGRLLKDS